jgi:hypothetical protein
MDNIDWIATAVVTLITGGGATTIGGFFRYMIGQYQQHAEKQRVHEKETQDRYADLVRETVEGFREVEKGCMESISKLADKVCDLAHAVTELRAELPRSKGA